MLTPAVKWLLIANVTAFLLNEVVGADALWRLFGLIPEQVWKGKVWQLGTYMFLHGGFSHLLFNMLALWMFGSVLESLWGTGPFLKYFFLTGVGAGLSNCILTPGSGVPIIGASGAVYGLLAAYGLLFPNSIIYLSFLFPIKAKYLVLIFGALEFFASLNAIGGASHVANLVHLGGMVIGVIYLKRSEILKAVVKRIQTSNRGQKESPPRRQEADVDQLRREVDDLLDKINEVGFSNLTAWEKRRLQQASEELKRKTK